MVQGALAAGKGPLAPCREWPGGGRDFESAVILEYLEETQPAPLHPHEPLERARHRSWIEFGSSILNRIAGFYNAKTDEALEAEARSLAGLFARVENELADGPWFSGERFSLVDAVYGPIFRYFDVFDRIGEFGILQGKPKAAGWRRSLSERPSIMKGVSPDYESRLFSFLKIAPLR